METTYTLDEIKTAWKNCPSTLEDDFDQFCEILGLVKIGEIHSEEME